MHTLDKIDTHKIHNQHFFTFQDLTNNTLSHLTYYTIQHYRKTIQKTLYKLYRIAPKITHIVYQNQR